MYSNNLDWFIATKEWDKIYQKWMDVFRDWIAESKKEILDNLNSTIFYDLPSILASESNKLPNRYFNSFLVNFLP